MFAALALPLVTALFAAGATDGGHVKGEVLDAGFQGAAIDRVVQRLAVTRPLGVGSRIPASVEMSTVPRTAGPRPLASAAWQPSSTSCSQSSRGCAWRKARSSVAMNAY